ncbi:MAG: PrgI family protein [Bacilli bacterium]|nr:PrgI family protein [Bacilli bacterium]
MDRIEPRIHDEIKDYKEKFYNFTLRQWIFGILILITTVPLYLVLSPKIGSNIAGWLVILVAIPIGFVGFIPIQGLNAERIMFFWKRNYINFAKPILYKTEEELLQEKNGKKKKTVVSYVSKKEQKNIQKLEKQKQKELQKERKKQREIARAKKKFGINNLENTQSNFSLSQEEAQVLLKLAKQVVGKEEIEINGSETKEDTPTKQEEA